MQLQANYQGDGQLMLGIVSLLSRARPWEAAAKARHVSSAVVAASARATSLLSVWHHSKSTPPEQRRSQHQSSG